MIKVKWLTLFRNGKDNNVYKVKESVLQDWVGECTLKQQTTLLSVIRGSDNECVSAKNITKMLRYLILTNADKGTEFMSDNILSTGKVVKYLKDNYGSNKHWVEHIVYAGFVIGKYSSNPYAKRYWLTVAGSVNNWIRKLEVIDKQKQRAIDKQKQKQRVIDKYLTIYGNGYM